MYEAGLSTMEINSKKEFIWLAYRRRTKHSKFVHPCWRGREPSICLVQELGCLTNTRKSVEIESTLESWTCWILALSDNGSGTDKWGCHKKVKWCNQPCFFHLSDHLCRPSSIGATRWMVPTVLRIGLQSSVHFLWKLFHRHIPKCPC